MTRAELAAELVRLANEMAVRSRSEYVDERAGRLVALAKTIPGLGPDIIERRRGERRQRDWPDTEEDAGMRLGGRRSGRRGVSDAQVGTVADILVITSDDPPGMVATDTHQLTWALRNQGTGGDIAGTVTFGSSAEGVATVDAAGLVTAVAVGSAVITASAGGLTDTVTITVTGASTPDAVSPTPTSISGQPTQTFPLVFQLTDGGTPVTGRTATAASSDTNVATVGAVDSGSDPQHGVTVTLVNDGSCNVNLGDSVAGVLGTVGVAVSTPSGVQPWYTEDFDYANIGALKANRGPGAWSPATEDQTPGAMTLGVDGGPPGGSGKYLRFTFAAAPSGVCGDRAVTINGTFPNQVQEIWLEIWNRFSTNWPTSYVNAGCAASNGYKHIFVRNHGIARYHFQVFMGGQGGKTMAGHPNHEQGPILGPVATTYADGTWQQWQVHAKAGASGRCAWGRNGTLLYDYGVTDISLATDLYGFSIGRTLNEQGVHAGLTVDWGLIKVFNNDPGWGW